MVNKTETEKDLTKWYWFSPQEYFQKKNAAEISACIERPNVPVVFLDSFCTYEMIKEKKGKSTNSHKLQFGRLRELITELIKKGKILSPLCIQEKEIGSPEKQHEIVDSLMDFTNIDFLTPSIVQNNMEQYAFLSFLKNANWFPIPFSVVMNTKSMEGSYPNFRVHISTNINQAEHKAEEETKNKTVAQLTALSESRAKVKYIDQLEAELSGDLQAFEIQEKKYYSSYYQWKCRQIKGLLQSIQYSTEKNEPLQMYKEFLKSSHHTATPSVWIRSVLWAQYITGHYKPKKSDPNDNAWASVYLPFTDYCFADKAFADLIKRTSLEKQFNTKVFSVKQFDQFLTELENML